MSKSIKFEIFAPVHGQRSTIVEIIAHLDGGETISAIGEALRHPNDKNDTELATLLANGRALEAMGKRLQRRANGLVRHNDYVAEQKEKKKKNPQARTRYTGTSSPRPPRSIKENTSE